MVVDAARVIRVEDHELVRGRSNHLDASKDHAYHEKLHKKRSSHENPSCKYVVNNRLREPIRRRDVWNRRRPGDVPPHGGGVSGG
jgi:hypothetical protein